MAVRVSDDILHRFRGFSLFNSPYPAHREGCAIDLYPGQGWVPSPVEGEVIAVRRVSAPIRSYAADADVMMLVDTGEFIARLLHVEPEVGPGDRVSFGEELGPPIRSGYFSPWVAQHAHLEFRPHDADPWRARGSVPLTVDVPVEGLAWVGTGTVIERAPSYVVLDEPRHPHPGTRFVGISAGRGGVLDGGVTHYALGGLLGGSPGPVSLGGVRIGNARDTGRNRLATVRWEEVRLLANDRPIRGLSCMLAKDGRFGAKLIEPDVELTLGDAVSLSIDRPSDASRPPEGESYANAQ